MTFRAPIAVVRGVPVIHDVLDLLDKVESFPLVDLSLILSLFDFADGFLHQLLKLFFDVHVLLSSAN